MGIRINVDGRLGTKDDRMLSPLELGFVFGASVYETLRTYGSSPSLLDRHLRRLRESAASLKITVNITDEEISSRVDETLASAANPESLIRLIVSVGVGDIDYREGAAPKPTVVILVKPLPLYSSREREGVVRVALVDVVRNHPRSVNPRIKSSNLLNNMLAMREALAKGADEAVMLNHKGEVAEGSLTNVFVVKDGAVRTPSLETGILAGITRTFVISLAREQGLDMKETVVLPDELFGADELFLTGTTKEVMPVAFVNDTTVGDGKPGPVSLALADAFRKKVSDLCAS